MAKEKSTALAKKSAPTELQPWEKQLMDEAVSDKAKETLGVPRLTHRGGEFKADGKTLGRSVKLAVIDWRFEKQYFEGAFDPNVPATPDCYAFGDSDKGMVAHPEAIHRQNIKDDGSSPCDGCKHNAFNTAEKGKGKRCKDVRRLMVISPTMLDGGGFRLDPADVARAEKRQLSIPPASLRYWSQYLSAIAPPVTRTGNAREMIVEVSTMALSNGGHGLNFNPVRPASGETLQAIMALKQQAGEALMRPYPVIDAGAREAETKANEKRAKKVR